MRTITLRKGDLLKALVHEPFSAGIYKDQIVRIIGFAKDKSPRVRVVGDNSTLVWYCSLKDLFHHFKKETR